MASTVTLVFFELLITKELGFEPNYRNAFISAYGSFSLSRAAARRLVKKINIHKSNFFWISALVNIPIYFILRILIYLTIEHQIFG
jgi:hypothetical protein